MSFPPLRISIFLFLHVAITFSLTSQDRRKLDSLREKLLIQVAPDTHRVKTLHAIAREMVALSPDSAMRTYQQAYQLSLNLHYSYGITKSLSGMGWCYERKGNFVQAIACYKRTGRVLDSIFLLDKSELAHQLNTDAVLERDSAIEATKRNEEAIRRNLLNKAEDQRQQHQRYFISIISFLALAVLALTLLVFRLHKQNKTRSHKTDSNAKSGKDEVLALQAAKQIQQIFQPGEKLWKSCLQEYFILSLSKKDLPDVFYWLRETEERVFLSLARLPASGLNGVLLRGTCCQALDLAVQGYKISEPGKILDKLGECIAETLGNHEMREQYLLEISLCSLLKPKQKNAATAILEWAGAQNPLWYVQNKKLTVVAGDKQPVGRYDHEKPFTTHRITLWKGDPLYIFSDGFADQFGGPDEKKIKYQKLQELLLQNYSKPMEEQKKLLEYTFNEWKSSLEQVDDVFVIGVRI